MACPLASAVENHSWLVFEGRFPADASCTPVLGNGYGAEGRRLRRVGVFLLHTPESWDSFWELRHGTSCSHQYLCADLAGGVLLPCCSRAWRAWWRLALPSCTVLDAVLEDDIHCHRVFVGHSSRHLILVEVV